MLFDQGNVVGNDFSPLFFKCFKVSTSEKSTLPKVHVTAKLEISDLVLGKSSPKNVFQT